MAKSASSWAIPNPLSETRIIERPPWPISMVIRELPASTAFSTSSLTTEAGRSTTSPAAILLERISGRILILDMRGFPIGSSFIVSDEPIEKLLILGRQVEFRAGFFDEPGKRFVRYLLAHFRYPFNGFAQILAFGLDAHMLPFIGSRPWTGRPFVGENRFAAQNNRRRLIGWFHQNSCP